MRPFRRLCAGAVCLCMCLGLVGCKNHNISFDDYDQPEVTPPAQRTAVAYGELSHEPFDHVIFLAAVDDAKALLAEEGAEEAVLQAYRDLTAQLSECVTALQLSQIDYYLACDDPALEEASNQAYTAANDCSDAFSGFLRDMLKSDYRDAYIQEVGKVNALMYEDYEDLTDTQQQLMDREQELEAEYMGLSNDEYETLADMAAVMAPLYLEMVQVRNQLASSFGYEDYPTYAYEQIYGRDYGPKEARELEDAVRAGLSGLYIDSILYMDEDAVDAPYRYTDTSEENLLGLMQTYLPQLDASLGDALQYMLDCGAYDITYSDSKFDASFTTMLNSANLPFLFSQPTTDSQMLSLGTLVHEFGHYYNYLVDPTYATVDGYLYASDNIDVAEIDSTGLELMFLRYYPELYGDDATVLQQTVVQDILGNVVMGCLFDEFQQQIYTTQDLQAEDISEIFHDIFLNYMGDVYVDDYAYNVWAAVNHNFTAPMYYISYAVSSLASLQLWERAQEDPDGAMQQYLDLASYGTGVVLRGLLEECDLRDVFDNDYLDDLYNDLESTFF